MKKLDKIIIIVFLLLSILPMGFLMLIKSDNENSSIIIKVDGKVEKTIPLNNKDTSEIYDFSFNENVGYVEVKNGRVRMLEMSKEICPNAICSDTGWINKGYQSIVCLPNNIIVTIEGNKDKDIDAQTY
ncbi:NusG domain II-containing protein [Clostridium sp. MSJ-11]|uniref:NusG domain II-containing protein n=2 Tax=Clostridium mobile TaxID=2841512 RepID=A0ABS6ED52_9CLOT|nr:NusG domain II-containing protein [Clostridium mobile]